VVNPYSLLNEEAYGEWRERKLSQFPKSDEDLVVDIRDLAHPTKAEMTAVRDRIRRANMAIYQGPIGQDVVAVKGQLRAFASHFGLNNLNQNPYADRDAITSVQVSSGAGRKLYIPYTNQAINWHTDGYYNTQDQAIHTMFLHCVRPAGGSGGENQLFDPEIAYILMRDHDPDMIRALSLPKALMIPGNDLDANVDRKDRFGPVFSVNESLGFLHMRYTARKRHVVWANDDVTQRAVEFLKNILGGPYTFHHRLKAGEGLICNNVLHTRSAFEDGLSDHQNRLILRGRFEDRLDGGLQIV